MGIFKNGNGSTDRSSVGDIGSSRSTSLRRLAKAAARFAASLGIFILAISTACAPAARGAHVTSVTPYSPDEKSHTKITINTGRTSLDTDDSVTEKLEILFEGQKLAVEVQNYSKADVDVVSDFKMSSDSPIIEAGTRSEVLASIALGLGLMPEPTDDEIHLASAGNLTGGADADLDVVGTWSSLGDFSAGSFAQSGSSTGSTSADGVEIGQGTSSSSTISVGDSANDEKPTENPGGNSQSVAADTEPTTTEQDDDTYQEPVVTDDSGVEEYVIVEIEPEQVDEPEVVDVATDDDDSLVVAFFQASTDGWEDSGNSEPTYENSESSEQDSAPDNSSDSNAGGSGNGHDRSSDDGVATSVTVVGTPVVDDEPVINDEPVIEDKPELVDKSEDDSAFGNSDNAITGDDDIGNSLSDDVEIPVTVDETLTVIESEVLDEPVTDEEPEKIEEPVDEDYLAEKAAAEAAAEAAAQAAADAAAQAAADAVAQAAADAAALA
ncbi:MAG: hypothetical protein V3T49_05075, partial [Dehalococcoidia bacterium]